MKKEIYLAGGCFWGTEHYFKQIRGVIDTEAGYANGHASRPTYQDVCTDQTGFAETVRIVYDPEIISLKFLLELYFKSIDPLSVNRQGHDHGTQYRTGIYYTDASDLSVIDEVYAAEQAKYTQPLAVEKQALQIFYEAEDYHQDYLDKHPDGYCHLPVALFEFVRQANAENEDKKNR
ncbi:MAG: peptide-methionine (S)-S-oxide reductase MsrA [Bacteroidales bacterium]|nr:peptide-methionine (S)-S-oxide reductase MsrA [Bacteroidales bacterium]